MMEAPIRNIGSEILQSLAYSAVGFCCRIKGDPREEQRRTIDCFVVRPFVAV